MKKKYLLIFGLLSAGLIGYMFLSKSKSKKTNTANGSGRVATKEEEAAITSSSDTTLNGLLDSKYNKPILNNYNPAGANVGQKSYNPANIRATSDNWKGQIGVAIAGKNGKFVVFDSNINGARAAFVILKNYIKNGNNTIKKIISRWAPSSDGNNTSNYINNVVRATGINSEVNLQFEQEANIISIMKAMIRIETAQDIGDNNLKIAYNAAK